MGGQGPAAERAAQSALRAERREKAVRLAAAGWTYAQIVAESASWEYGYNTVAMAHKDVRAALAERLKRQDLAVDEMREKHTVLLEEALKAAHEVMNTKHLAHGNGRIVRREVEQPDGSVILEDVYDDGPRLAAIDRLQRVSESIRKLWGYDAPAKVEQQVSGTVGYSINVDPGEMDQL
jgi:hypothetical protein